MDGLTKPDLRWDRWGLIPSRKSCAFTVFSYVMENHYPEYLVGEARPTTRVDFAPLLSRLNDAGRRGPQVLKYGLHSLARYHGMVLRKAKRPRRLTRTKHHLYDVVSFLPSERGRQWVLPERRTY